MSKPPPKADGRRYHSARQALSEAFEAARKVNYAPGSPEMARLAQAQAYCKEIENPNARSEPHTDAATER